MAPGDVELAFAAPNSAPWSFVVRRAPLDWMRVTSWRPSCKGLPRAVAKMLIGKTKNLTAEYGDSTEDLRDLHRRIRARMCS